MNAYPFLSQPPQPLSAFAIPKRDEEMSAKEIVESEQLDRPSESVEFLHKYHMQQLKVKEKRQTLRLFSYMLAIVGVAALAYCAYAMFVHVKASRPQTVSSTKRLRTSNVQDQSSLFFNADGSLDATTALHGVSVLIWGLIVTKAKQGLNAADCEDSATVSGFVQKTFALCSMILVAAGIQWYSDSNGITQVKSVQPAGLFDLAGLQSLEPHNNRDALKKRNEDILEKLGKTYKQNPIVRGTKSDLRSLEIGSGAALSFFVLISVGYYMTLNSYHAELEKFEQLDKLYRNPNARVAAKSEGKRIMKRLKSAKTTGTGTKQQTYQQIADMLAKANTNSMYQVAPQPCYYPQMQAPLLQATPVPSYVQQPVDLSKSQLVNMLLQKLANE